MLDRETLSKVFNQSELDPNMFMFQDGRFNIGSSYAEPYMCIIRHDTDWRTGKHQDYFEWGFPWQTAEELADFFEKQGKEMNLCTLIDVATKLRAE